MGKEGPKCIFLAEQPMAAKIAGSVHLQHLEWNEATEEIAQLTDCMAPDLRFFLC
ncbi:MAG: hypothetical protein V3U62_09465 [Sedimenticolaceae bacterium]